MNNLVKTARCGMMPLALALLWAAVGLGQQISVNPDKASGVYASGEKIGWKITAEGADLGALKQVKYTLKKNASAVLREGTVDLSSGSSHVDAKLSEPGTLLLEVSYEPEGKPKVSAQCGAVVDPQKIQPAPRPADFDAFWNAKLKELAAIPANPKLQKADSGNDKVDYYTIQLDNIRGMHVQGQLGVPKGGGKHPAILVLQWAGVYGLPKDWVVGRANDGWLAMNIEPHDLPCDKPEDFYKQQGDGPLRDYPSIGNDNRETSYFLRMFLGCSRAVDYLASRDDWDGKVLVANGGSQGGLQSFAAAALNPKVTAVVTEVPAGSDMLGPNYGRSASWPGWFWATGGKDAKKVHETSRYFDQANLASRVKCPTLVCVGLVDGLSPAYGVIAAYNQIHAPKQIIIMPAGEHGNNNNTHQPYYAASDAFMKNLLKNADHRLPVK